VVAKNGGHAKHPEAKIVIERIWPKLTDGGEQSGFSGISYLQYGHLRWLTTRKPPGLAHQHGVDGGMEGGEGGEDGNHGGYESERTGNDLVFPK